MESRLHSLLGVLPPSFLVDSDDLGRAGGVKGAYLRLSLKVQTTDDQVVLEAQLGSNQVQSSLHLPGVFRGLEVDEWLIPKGALGQEQPRFCFEGVGFHDVFSVVQTWFEKGETRVQHVEA